LSILTSFSIKQANLKENILHLIQQHVSSIIMPTWLVINQKKWLSFSR